MNDDQMARLAEVLMLMALACGALFIADFVFSIQAALNK
jgi:hypothetical protein